MSFCPLESFRLPIALCIVAFFSVGQFAAKAAAPPARVKVLTLKQNHYVLGNVDVRMSKNAIRMYNSQNDVTIMVSIPERKVREFSVKRKILFERSLDDFLKRGSSANWDFDENILRMIWFPAKREVFLGRKAKLLICPINPNTVARLLQQGKAVDLEKHKSAHYWYMPAEGCLKEAPAILSVLYRLPINPGVPVELECKFMGSNRQFWQQAPGDKKVDDSVQGVRKILSTKSISESMEDAKLFEFKDTHYKRAREESEVYLTKDTNTMLENMFAPDGDTKNK